MKKIALIAFFLTTILNAQISSVPSGGSSFGTRFSDTSVNESSGRLVKNVPFLNYTVGKLSVPLSFNYVGNGVKVLQQSNWVGTNWDLSAGGVVTRVVNSYPDEQASQRIYFDEIAGQSSYISYLPQTNDTRDFRADLFSFSFPGYSGSFYLDKNMAPRLMDNSTELKIEFVEDLSAPNNTILITTPEGVKYYFGGQNASEKSSTMVSTPLVVNQTTGTTDLMQTVAPLATTAFYLFKIENFLGDQILIDYYDDGTKNFVLFEKEKLSMAHPLGDSCEDIDNFQGLKSAVFHGTIYNSKKIKKIYSLASNLSVIFNSSNLFLPHIGVINTPEYDDRRLNSIELYNSLLNETVQKVNLEYYTTSSRFFLTKISMVNSSNPSGVCESYKFEYKTPSYLPKRFSKDVDMLGYYNGNGNATLIPQNQNLEFDNVYGSLALREPNFQYASYGVLTKMTSPTGGVTEFEYESPSVVAIKDTKNFLQVWRNDFDNPSPNEIEDTFTIGGESVEATGPILHNPKDQKLKVSLNAGITGVNEYGQPYTGTVGNQAIIEVLDIGTGAIQSDYILLNLHFPNRSKSCEFSLWGGHDYRITLKLSPATFNSTDAPVWAYATFTYENYASFPTMGLRLKSIANKGESDSVQNYTRYYYKKAADMGTFNDESPVVTFKTSLPTSFEQYCCNTSNAETSFQVVSLSVDPFSNYFAPADNQVQYKYVTLSYGGDNFEQGGLEKKFQIDLKTETELYLYGPFAGGFEDVIDFGANNLNNSDCYNGTLLGQKEMKKIGSDLYFINETQYTYSQNIEDELQNVVVLNNPYGCLSPTTSTPNTIEEPVIGHFSMFSFRNDLTSIVKKEFLQPLAINSTSTVRTITNATDMEYSYLRGLPKNIKAKDSKGNTIITEYKYPVPGDLWMLTDLDNNNLTAYNTLYNQNNIVSPIQTTIKKQGIDGVTTTLNTTRSLFLVNASDQALPQKVVTSKGNSPLKGNVEFTAYDSNNNLVEVTQENQIKKSIIYGYNNQVIIAELNNVAYGDLVPTMIIDMLKNTSDNIIANNPAITGMTDEDLELELYNNLNVLRSWYPDAVVTTKVYDKYLQLKSTTDARGYTVYHEYDNCRRLRMTKDKDGKIIEEYKYNLKNN